ncbi:MAG TPA: flagellar type III secretion system protein FliR [Clostridiaceae bacterium]|nr:flagellar type III secretion system protein FliR [Clostridiaceae bacterium]HHV99055.1 flagellar type III secretion system protein FliR [Clostridiaceae bacterium]
MTGLFIISPVFGRRNIPVYLKIGFSVIMSLILINTIQDDGLSSIGNISNVYQYMLVVLKEFITGLMIGFVSYIFFSVIYLAGQLIDVQTGFAMVNVLDPASNIQMPITSNLYYIISMIVFLGIRGHHMLIKAVFDSYKFVPIGGAVFDDKIVEDFIRIFGEILATGVKIAAPVTAAIILTDVALGILSKTIPQMNIFIVGMPLKIVMGIVIIMLSLPLFIMLLGDLFSRMNEEIINFINSIRTG